MRQDETIDETAFHYGDYLRSERWQALREAALAEAEGRCRVCNSTEALNVHHRSYDRLGQDGEERDLVVLCEICHEGYHFLIAAKSPRRANRETMAPISNSWVFVRADGTREAINARLPG